MISVLLYGAIRRSAAAARLDASLMVPWPPASPATAPATRPPARSRLFSVALRTGRAALFAFTMFHVWYIAATSLVVACFVFVDPAATTLSVYRKYADGWKIIRPVPAELTKIPKTADRKSVV